MSNITGVYRLLLAGFLLTIGVGFYMICESNPLRWDDLMYQYVWLDHKQADLLHPIDLSNRVDDFHEAFVSQCNHYKVMNGRFIVHYITQCFCGFIGKGPFNYLNAFIYILFLIMGIYFTKAFSFSRSIFVITGLWLLPPVQWIMSFDVVFPINYLWSATMCIAFLVIFHHFSEKSSTSIWKNASLLILGIICGNFHEGYSLLISGALFFYVITHFKSIKTNQWCLIIGMWIGTLTVIGSPGIWNRAAGASAESIEEAFIRKLDILRYSKRLYILIALMAVSYLWLGKKKLISFIKDNQIEIMVVVLGLLFLFLLPYYSQRMGFPMELFAVLLSLKLLLQYKVNKTMRYITTIIMPILLFTHLFFTIKYARIVGEEYYSMINEYQNSEEGIAHFQSFEIPKLLQPYVYRLGVPFEQGLISFTMDKEMIIEP